MIEPASRSRPASWLVASSVVFLAAALLFLASSAVGQEAPPPLDESQLRTPAAPSGQWPEPQDVEPRGSFSTKVGHGSLATMPGEIERVALADDSVARVQIISPWELLLTGLRPGRTTVHVWLVDGRRLVYELTVQRDLDLLRRALRNLDERIRVETTPDAVAVVLYGEVASEEAARAAQARAASLAAGAEVVNLLTYPGLSFSVEDRLVELLEGIDPRIRLRRIQVDAEPDVNRDTFVLEGQVRSVQDLVKAVTLAERQLGGTGSRVSAVDTDRVGSGRFRGFGSGVAGSFGSRALAFDDDRGGGRAGRGLGGSDPRSVGLLAQLARGLVVTSESGRVVSFLKLDEMPQVSVSIRVLEIDRTKTRKAGINFRVDGEHLSIGSYVSPQVESLPSTVGGASVDGLTASAAGNFVAAFVDQTQAILTAIDFLQQKQFARSVAEPTISTLSGELASVLIGGEIPIETAAVGAVAAVSGFFFQEFGVRLDIRPTVTGDHMVALEVAPSIIRPTAALAVGSVPGFQVQTVNTTAAVPAGQSMVIGGLMAYEDGLEDRRVPGLGKFPLFRWKRNTRQERELVFIITPQLIAPLPPPTEPVEQPEVESIVLPELDWSEDRRRWRDEFEPRYLEKDGVPYSFVPVEIEVREPAEYVPVEEPAVAAPAAAEPPGEIEETALPSASSLGTFYVAPTARPCLDFRPAPDSGSAPLGCLEPGTRVQLLRQAADGWSWVKLADGRDGWVPARHLVQQADDAASGVHYVADTASPCLNLRPSPGFENHPDDCLEPGTRVIVMKQDSDGWSRVRLSDGRGGWMAARHLVEPPETSAELPSGVYYVTPSADPCLNLRPEPNFWQAPVDCLEPGTRVEVIERSGGWLRVVLHDGRQGWVAGSYFAESLE